MRNEFDGSIGNSLNGMMKNPEILSPVLRDISGVDDERDAGSSRPEETPESRKMRERCEKFQSQNEKIVNGYFGTPDVAFSLRAGEGAYIDLEKIRVNIDPELLFRYDMTDSQALFVVFHEAEHFRDMIRDPDVYTGNFDRIRAETGPHEAFPKALRRLFNCVDDVLVNKAVMRRWKAGEAVKDPLYRKLFSSPILNAGPDGQPVPRHRQFMYALLRRAMLPDEETVVDEDVEDAICEATDRGEGKADLTSVMTAVDRTGKAILEPADRFFAMWKFCVPVFRRLYEQDLTDHAPKENPKEKPFGDDPLEGAIPDPIDSADVADAAKSIATTLGKKKNDEYTDLYGVTREDFDRYKRDYDEVEPHIDDLSRTFDAVIERRKTVRRVLRKPVRDGVMLDPRKAAIVIAEMKAGNDDPQVELGYERRETIMNLPSAFEFTLVGDGSGSMKGSKSVLQRKLSVLVTEALKEFQDRLDAERRKGADLRLSIKTEVRIVSNNDSIAKPLSTSLSHEERVKMGKALRNLPYGDNNEPETFRKMETEQFDPETCAKLRDGRLKKAILFLTDGETDKAAIQRCITRLEDLVNEGRSGEGNGLVVAGLGFGEGTSALDTYAPNGYYADSFAKVPDIFKDFLKDILETL
jgi:hypothetical protein